MFKQSSGVEGAHPLPFAKHWKNFAVADDDAQLNMVNHGGMRQVMRVDYATDMILVHTSKERAAWGRTPPFANH